MDRKPKRAMNIGDVRKMSNEQLINALLTNRESYAIIVRACLERMNQHGHATLFSWASMLAFAGGKTRLGPDKEINDDVAASVNLKKREPGQPLRMCDLTKRSQRLLDAIRDQYKPLYLAHQVPKSGDWKKPYDEQEIGREAATYLETFYIWTSSGWDYALTHDDIRYLLRYWVELDRDLRQEHV